MLTESPQTIGGVLDAGIRLYRNQFLALTKTAAAVFGAAAVFNVLFVAGFGIDLYPAAQAGASLADLYTPPLIALTLIGWAIGALGYSALLCQLHAAAEGTSLDVGGAVRAGARRMVPVALAVLLYYLAVAIGTVLLIIPGIWAGTAYGLSTYFAADRSGPIAAMRESMRLVSGHWWRTTALFIVVLLIILVLSLTLGGIAGFFVGVSAAANGGQPAMGVQLLSIVANTLSTIFVMPIGFAMGYAIYHDLRLRRSGDDLASRLEGMDA